LEACSPAQGLSKNGKKYGPKFTNFAQKWTKVQILTPNILSPTGFWAAILTSSDTGP